MENLLVLPKYPHVEIELPEEEISPFTLMGQVRNGLRAAKVEPAELSAFFDEAIGEDFDHLIETCKKWVTLQRPKSH